MNITEIRKLAKDFVFLTKNETDMLITILRNEYHIDINDDMISPYTNLVEDNRYGLTSLYLKKIPSGFKLRTLKMIKDRLGIGLKEARDIIESVPTKILDNVSKSEAEILRKELNMLGCDVECF